MNLNSIANSVLFILLLLSLSFASESHTASTSTTFYQPNSLGIYYVSTDVYLRNQFSLSTTSEIFSPESANPNDLPDEVIICVDPSGEASITASSQITGSFANNVWYATVPAPSVHGEGEFISWSGARARNLLILFSHFSYSRINIEDLYTEPGAPEYSLWPTLHEQRIDIFSPYTNEPYYDKMGKVSMLCDARVTFSERSTSISVDLESTSASADFDSLPPGEYNFRSRLSLRECVMMVEKVGGSQQRKYMFSSVDPDYALPFGYFMSRTDSITVHVIEGAELTLEPLDVANAGGRRPPYCFGPEGEELSESVWVTIRNTGEIDAIVGGASIFPAGFSLDGDVLEGWCVGEEIEAGTSKQIPFLIVYDGETPIDDRPLQLIIDFISEEEICGEYVTDSIVVEINKEECEEEPEIEYVCEISPPSIGNAEIGEPYRFTFEGCNDGEDFVDCTITSWELEPEEWLLEDTTPASDVHKEVTATSSGSGTLIVKAEYNQQQIKCTAWLFTGKEYYCEIEPSDLDMEIGVAQEFALHCYDVTSGTPSEVPCANEGWSLTPGVWGLSGLPFSPVTVTPTGEGEGTLSATATYEGSPLECDAALSTLAGGEEEVYCDIRALDGTTLEVGESFLFQFVSCTCEGEPIACRDFEWHIDSPDPEHPWILEDPTSPPDDEGVYIQVTPTSVGAGTLSLTAHSDRGDTHCSLNLNAIIGGIEEEDYYCELSPSEYSNMDLGHAYEFTSHCYNATSGIPEEVLCESESWALEPLGWILGVPAPGDLYDRSVTPNSEAEGSITLTTSYNENNLVCEALLSTFPPVIEGNQCILSSEDIEVGIVPEAESASIDITCYENSVIVDCTDVNWEVDGGSFDSYSNSGSIVLPSEEEEGLSVEATVHYGTADAYNCDLIANINHGKSCRVRVVSIYPQGFGTFKYNVTCYDGSAVDCSDLEGELGGELSWQVEIEDLNPMLYTWTPHSEDNSIVLEVSDYLNTVQAPKDLEITATITPSVPEEEILECSLSTMLPNLYCGLFI